MLQLQNISKKFFSKTVLEDISFSLSESKITTLVGANGCGKTTTIRIIAGLLKPDSGKIIISDKDNIGVLLGGDVSLYENLTGYENIKYFAQLRGISKLRFESRCKELSEILGFENFMHKKSAVYSRGMKQKIAFAITLIHDPMVLLLDEPSTGLDIPTGKDVLEFIKYCRSIGKTILISTHNISEIADFSDHMIMMSNGKIKYDGKTKNYFENCSSEERILKIANDLMEDN